MKLARLLRRDPAAPTLRERAAALREGLSRREAVIGTAATITVAPLPVVAASTGEAHRDAELIALWQKREAANREWLSASDRLEAARDAHHSVEWPEALAVQLGDDDLGLARLANHEREGRKWYWVGDLNADPHLTPASKLRQPRLLTVTRPVCPEDNLPADAQRVVSSKPWPDAQARADEIVAAWDARQAEAARQNAINGYDAAVAHEHACEAALYDIESEIVAAEAHTVAGLAIKARLVNVELERGFGPSDDLLRSITATLITLGAPVA